MVFGFIASRGEAMRGFRSARRCSTKAVKLVAFSLMTSMALVASVAEAQVAQVAQVRLEGFRPPNDNFAPRDAASHVAVRVVRQTNYPHGSYLVTVFRSGRWQREEWTDKTGNVRFFSDYERGISFVWRRQFSGEEWINANQNSPGSWEPLVGTLTGEVQRWAGESCKMWSWRYEDKPEPLSRHTCVTTDGIVLWEGDRRADGTFRENFHVMTLRRGSVPIDAARLPPTAFDWRLWSAQMSLGDVSSGHEVTLAGDSQSRIFGSSRVSILKRQRGDWQLTERELPEGYNFGLEHPRARLTFVDETDLRRLTFYRVPADWGRLAREPVLNETSAPQTILGLSCRNYNMAPDLTDAGSGECRTVDGITLSLGESSWGQSVLWARAVSVSELPASEKAMAPPEKVFDWITGEDVERFQWREKPRD